MPPAAVRRLRDAALAGMAAPEWGTELGLMYLRNELSAALYETGRRWVRLVEAWRHATGCPSPHPRSAGSFERAGRSPEPDPASELARRQLAKDRAVIDDMVGAHKALAVDPEAARAVRTLCEANEVPVGASGRDAVLRGLTTLARFWGILAPVKNSIRQTA